MPSKLWYLTNHKLLGGLPRQEMDAVERMTQMVTAPRYQQIYLPGDASDTIYLLKKGTVRLSRISESGKQMILSILGPGDMFGELALMDGERNEIAEAMEETYLCLVPKGQFEQLMMKNPTLALKVTKLMGLRLRQIQNRVEDIVFRDAAGRVAQLLLNLEREHGAPHLEGRVIGLKLSQQDMADLTGLTRQTVSETLSDWKAAGWLGSEGRQVVLRDLPQLQSLAQRS
jgi:CRP/FNR family transcriptional regulator